LLATTLTLVMLSTVLHAGWNLLLGSQKSSYMLLRIALIIVIVGVAPALLAEYFGTPFSLKVWIYAAFSGIFMAVYNLGLTRGYQSGDFTVVYPVARALPILMVAFIDVGRGHAPSTLAWIGMFLVLAGCIVTPLESVGSVRSSNYLNLTMIWTIIAAMGTVGYSSVDNAAADHFPAGPLTAARYGIYEFGFSALFYWLILLLLGEQTGDGRGWEGWKLPTLGAIGVFGAYWLILWSYQLSPQASYIVATRQFSIVIGVIIGTYLFREPAGGMRIATSFAIVGGLACIVLGG
jgi:drug/metabolite transporter (DMT)-like permease